MKKKFAVLKTIFTFLSLIYLKNRLIKVKKRNKKLINLKNDFFIYFVKSFKYFNSSNQRLIDLKKKSFLFINKSRSNFNKVFLKRKKFNKSFLSLIKKKKNLLNINTIGYSELSVHSLLIKNKVFLNYSDFFFFLKNRYFFLNKNHLNLKKKIQNGDFLEIILFKNYLLYLLKNFILMNKIKNINFIKKKINFKTKKIIDNYLLKKLKIDFYNKNNLSNLIEIDFLTLSLFLIKSTTNLNNLNFKTKKFLNIFFLNFFKWKLLS